jgi:hypothetical protein
MIVVMVSKLRAAGVEDVPEIVPLRVAVAEKLIAQHGRGHWSAVATEKGVQYDLRNPRVFVAYDRNRLVATLRLTTRKSWAIDPANK